MVYHGHVEHGKVVLDEHVELPDGVRVEVSVLAGPEDGGEGEERPTLYERLKPIVGMAKGLPSDLAENHDYYLYGVPKK
jgi:hypothetical protein